VVLFSLLLLVSIDIVSSEDVNPSYWPTNEWKVSQPEEHFMNVTILNELVQFINDQGYAIDSLLIIREGYLVLEEYFSPYYRSRPHQLYSVTKSITSSLIGIAIEKGFIKNIDQRVIEFLPGYEIASLNTWKENITIKHLLTMTSGLQWDETIPYTHSDNTYIQLMNSPDWLQFIFDQNVTNEPGVEWNYNTGGSHLLSAILERATGQSTSSFADEYLFGPLGIVEYTWTTDPQGITNGGSGLSMYSRDMAKFGYLYLNNGSWEGQEIVSNNWVVESTKNPINLTSTTDYGYQWWIHPYLQSYNAAGYEGQHIFIFPTKDMVITFTSSIPQGTYLPNYDLIEDFVLPATQPIIYSDVTSSNNQETPIRIDFIGCLIVLIKFQKRNKSISDVIA
jgi:CubicO group peptidase (beta-lactamase class C family)